MKSMSLLGLVGLFLFGMGCLTVEANFGPPPGSELRRRADNPEKFAWVPVEIRHEDLSKQGDKAVAVLRIPKNLLPEIARGSAPAAKAEGQPAPKSDKQGNVAPMGGTVIAGLALSAAAVSLVLVFRRRERGLAIMASLVVGIGIVAMCGILFADIPIPGQPFRPRGPIEPPVPETELTIEILDSGKHAILILPEAPAAKEAPSSKPTPTKPAPVSSPK